MDEWNRASLIVAHIASQYSKRPRQPGEFNPWVSSSGKPGRVPLSVGLLKTAYIDSMKPVK